MHGFVRAAAAPSLSASAGAGAGAGSGALLALRFADTSFCSAMIRSRSVAPDNRRAVVVCNAGLQCEICSLRFDTPEILEGHTKKAHDGIIFSCVFCFRGLGCGMLCCV